LYCKTISKPKKTKELGRVITLQLRCNANSLKIVL